MGFISQFYDLKTSVVTVMRLHDPHDQEVIIFHSYEPVLTADPFPLNLRNPFAPWKIMSIQC